MSHNLDLFNINHNLSKLEKGKCLISEPFSPDSFFGRSIVLITEHNSDEGTLGYILNKPVEIPIDELFPDFPDFDAQCYIGGPVATDTIHFIHTRNDLIPDSTHIVKDIFVGGDFDTLKELVNTKQISPDEIRFFLGYSGWAPKQLTTEIDEKHWIVSDITPDQIMKINENSWEEVLTKMGDSYALWAKSPANPTLN